MAADHGLVVTAVFLGSAIVGLVTAPLTSAAPLRMLASADTADAATVAAGVRRPTPQAGGDCPAPPDDGIAQLEARRAELQAQVAQLQARTDAREGRPHDWPQLLDERVHPDHLVPVLEAWRPPDGIDLHELDCSEYPCMAVLQHDQQHLDLDHVRQLWDQDPPRTYLVLAGPDHDDGGWQSVVVFADPDHRLDIRDTRTRWRSNELAGYAP